MRLLLVAACLMAAVDAVVAQTPKRPIRHEDVWLMRGIGAPAVSPDGRWAVISVTEPSYDPDDVSSDLWILAVEGEQKPRRLTANKAAEAGVTWSRDGARLAFSSKRSGDAEPQIYLLDLAEGGEAVRLTQRTTGARSPRFSPDGRRILYVSDVEPGAGADGGETEAGATGAKPPRYRAFEYESAPVRHWDRWLDDRRASLFVQEATAGAEPRDLLAGTRLFAQDGFAGLRGEAGEDIPATWTPDGKAVVFVASTNEDRQAYAETDTDLFVASIAGGEPRRLTQDAHHYGRPLFTPDGHWLVGKVTPGGTGYAYNGGHIARFPWPFDLSRKVILTEGFDRDPNEPVIAGDGTWVYFTAEDAGQENVYGVDIEGGETQLEYQPPAGTVSHLGGGGAGVSFRLVGVMGSAVSPPEIIAHQPGDTAIRQLTHFNAERVAGLDLFPVEHFWIQNSQSQRVHSMLVRPPGFDPAKKYPVLAVVHGGPNTMFRDNFVTRWNYHLLAAPGYVVVLTNYTGSTGFGETFARGVHGNPLRTSAADVSDAVDEVLRKYAFADGSRVAVAGASYGGHIVNWLQATTTRYRCLVAHAGAANLETLWGASDVQYSREQSYGGPIWEQGGAWREQNPVRLVGNHFEGTGWITPILLTAGERDFRVPLSATLENWSYLQRLKVPSRLVVFPDENHWILNGENSRRWYAELQAWLERWYNAGSGSAPGEAK